MIENRCGDFTHIYFNMKYRDNTLLDIWSAREHGLQGTLVSKTKNSIVKGVNRTLTSRGLQGVTLATVGTQFIEATFTELVGIKALAESTAMELGISLGSLYSFIGYSGLVALSETFTFTCKTTTEIKHALVVFIEMLEFLQPPRMVRELRLDIFLDLLREELVKKSIFDKDYLNHLLSHFQSYDDFVLFSETVAVPDYEKTIPVCLLLMQDFETSDLSTHVLELVYEFCKNHGVDCELVLSKFDDLNSKSLSEAINTQRTLADNRRRKRSVVRIDELD